MDKTLKVMKTSFLLPKGGFLVGMGSVFNIAGNYFRYNSSESAEVADYKALCSDWSNVGSDIEVSMNKYSSNIEEKEKSTKEKSNKIHIYL